MHSATQQSAGRWRWAARHPLLNAATGALTVGAVGAAAGYGYSHGVALAAVAGVIGAVLGAAQWRRFAERFAGTDSDT